jgi:hypothetical protein
MLPVYLQGQRQGGESTNALTVQLPEQPPSISLPSRRLLGKRKLKRSLFLIATLAVDRFSSPVTSVAAITDLPFTGELSCHVTIASIGTVDAKHIRLV